MKFWVSVSPLARLDGDNWICSVYKKGKKSWITGRCKTHNSPEDAQEWASKIIRELEDEN